MSASKRAVLAVMVTAGAGLVTGGLSVGSALATGAVVVPAPAVAAVLLGAGALLVGASFRALTPPGTLSLARGLPAAILLRGVLTVGFFGLYAYVSLALIEWRGLSAVLAGLAIAAGSLAWTAGAWAQARGAVRRGYAFFVRWGFAAVTAGALLFAVGLDRSLPLVLSFVAFGLAGFGMGLSYAPQSLIVLHEAAPGEQGAATSALSLSDLLGTALGTGLTGAILAAGLRAGATTGAALLPAFGLAAAVTAIGFALSGRLGMAAPRIGAASLR
jgi:predicted MFS family arabinose efflux permease